MCPDYRPFILFSIFSFIALSIISINYLCGIFVEKAFRKERRLLKLMQEGNIQKFGGMQIAEYASGINCPINHTIRIEWWKVVTRYNRLSKYKGWQGIIKWNFVCGKCELDFWIPRAPKYRYGGEIHLGTLVIIPTIKGADVSNVRAKNLSEDEINYLLRLIGITVGGEWE